MNVLPPITTRLLPISLNVIPPAVMTCVCPVAPGPGMVVRVPIPTPLGPMDIVWPFTTSVVGVAPGVSVKVWLPMTTMLEPISDTVTPAAVKTCVGPASGAEVTIPGPAEPRVNVWLPKMAMVELG